MKSIKTVIALMLLGACFIAQPVQAQFRIGPKVGLNVNSIHFNKEILSADNRAGFNAGLMAEFTVPVIGIGADISAMYVRRSADINDSKTELSIDKREYIEIPINLKWKINIPVVNHIVRPFLTTGPSFAFLTSRKHFTEFYENKKTDVAWNFGFGVEMFRHVQVAASYGLGMTKAFKYVGVINEAAGIEGKNRYWTVTAAYLF